MSSSFSVGEDTFLACQGDESRHRDDRADHAEEYGGSNFCFCGAVLDS